MNTLRVKSAGAVGSGNFGSAIVVIININMQYQGYGRQVSGRRYFGFVGGVLPSRGLGCRSSFIRLATSRGGRIR